jgi:hypothetical protein
MVRLFRCIQSSENWKDWAFWSVAKVEVDRLVALGEAMAVTRLVDGEVELVGFRATVPVRWEQVSPATLTFATMKAVSERDGELTRRQRDEVSKFDVWALIGDTKAVAVRPRMSDADLRRAVALMPEFRGLLHRGSRVAIAA